MLEVSNLEFSYDDGSPILKDISFSISKGERVALLGPSGYGKSTLGKIIAGHMNPDKGTVLLNNQKLSKYKGYKPIQLIYQHAEKALNNRWKIKDSLYEAWDIPVELLERMGINQSWLDRWPNELSGGQLQRISVLRALSPKTQLLIADEITASLDTITQAQLWNVVGDVLDINNTSLLMITHNESLAKRICSRIIQIESLCTCT